MPRKITAKNLPPAPGELRIVQAFINTANLEAGTDEFASPRALASWLANQGLVPAGAELGADDLERALAVREEWRSLVGAAAPVSPRLQESLDRAVASTVVRVVHDPQGKLCLAAVEPGLDAALARMMTILSAAQHDGRWELLKVCASRDCRAVFYDYSTNHTAKWCHPRCGNRSSARSSRRRTRRNAKARREHRNRETVLQMARREMPDPASDPYIEKMEALVREPDGGSREPEV